MATLFLETIVFSSRNNFPAQASFEHPFLFVVIYVIFWAVGNYFVSIFFKQFWDDFYMEFIPSNIANTSTSLRVIDDISTLKILHCISPDPVCLFLIFNIYSFGIYYHATFSKSLGHVYLMIFEINSHGLYFF